MKMSRQCLLTHVRHALIAFALIAQPAVAAKSVCGFKVRTVVPIHPTVHGLGHNMRCWVASINDAPDESWEITIHCGYPSTSPTVIEDNNRALGWRIDYGAGTTMLKGFRASSCEELEWAFKEQDKPATAAKLRVAKDYRKEKDSQYLKIQAEINRRRALKDERARALEAAMTVWISRYQDASVEFRERLADYLTDATSLPVTKCRALALSAAKLRRDLGPAPDPRVARALDSFLNDFRASAAACQAGRGQDAAWSIEVGKRSLLDLKAALSGYGIEP